MNGSDKEKGPDRSVDLTNAFEVLRTYKSGSGRSGLNPLDELVMAAMVDDALRKTVEQQLVAALSENLSPEATEYVCSKLALIGSEAAAPALLPLLADVRLSTASRNALESIPGETVSRLLRQTCSNCTGPQRVAAIYSIAERRDALAVSLLRKLLFENDTAAASAAAFALGRIANVKAATALREFLPHAPLITRTQTADAALSCAERLIETGQPSAAKALCEALNRSPNPPHIRNAATKLAQAVPSR